MLNILIKYLIDFYHSRECKGTRLNDSHMIQVSSCEVCLRFPVPTTEVTFFVCLDKKKKSSSKETGREIGKECRSIRGTGLLTLMYYLCSHFCHFGITFALCMQSKKKKGEKKQASSHHKTQTFLELCLLCGNIEIIYSLFDKKMTNRLCLLNPVGCS